MKERILPDSFWLPPNRPTNNIRKPAPSNELFETRTGLITITSPPDTNLLFSLFKILEQSKQHKAPPECLTNRLVSKRSKEILPSDVISKHFETATDSTEEGVDDEDLMVEEQQHQQKQLKIMDDPYLSLKQEHTVMGKKILKLNENYSDLLSDLVVNL